VSERANERSSFINNRYFSEYTMDIRALLTRVDVIENNQLSLKKYLSESLYNTPEMQSHWKRIDEGFVRGYEKYLAEVALTPEQIQSIFKQASAGAAAGEAPKDPGKLAALVDKVLPAEQAGALEKTLPEPDAGPVQGFEQKAAAAVQNIQGADQATKQSLMQWIKQGVAKPETQQLILAAVGAGVGSLISKVGPVLSMIPGGGPVVAAITGAVIAGAVSVASAKLQGKDWKTAFKGAIKPALMGGASAVIGNLATTAISAMSSGGDANTAAQQGDQSTPGVSNTPASNGQTELTPAQSDKMTAATMRAGVGADVNNQQPMTLDQVNAAKAALRAGNATDMSVPMDAPAKDAAGITARPTMQSLNNLDGSERPGAADSNAGKVRANLDQWRTDTGSPNAPKPTIGSNFDAGIAPIGANGQPMQVVPMDEPATGRMPGETPPGINRLTGQPISSGPAWDQMTPDQQAAVTARQQQQASDAAQGTQNAKDYWANKNPNTRGLKESFAECKYVDKQATLRKWLVQESKGQRVHGLQLKATVKEGIMDSIKGMFGGGKKGDAPAAGGVTADTLNKAWAAAGSPTDSEEVAKVLQSAGVPAETVSKVFADLKLPEPTGQIEPKMDPEQTPATEPTAPETPATEPETGTKELTSTPPAAGGVNIDNLVAQINKLAPADKQKIIAALQG
jgi:hypothetical protein